MPTIHIRTYPKIRLLPSLWAFGLQVGVIGIGVVADSQAMQWAGFILFGLLAVAVAVTSSKRDDALTISEARKRLDEIEAKEARP